MFIPSVFFIYSLDIGIKISTEFSLSIYRLVFSSIATQNSMEITIFYTTILARKVDFHSEFLFFHERRNVQISFSSHIMNHSSEIRGLCLMKSSSEMLQYLPYFIYTKNQSCFFHFSFCATLVFPLMNALVYVDIDLGIK